MGRSRFPPASATCSPSSRTSWTGESASSRLISASQARSAVLDELPQALAEDAFHAEAHATPLATGRTWGRIATVSE